MVDACLEGDTNAFHSIHGELFRGLYDYALKLLQDAQLAEDAVQAGVVYTFSATLTKPGSTNTWVEFYFGASTPAQGSDYTDNKLWSLNTWSGCGGGPETGDIVQLNCAGSGASTGQITFPQNETIYFLIKAGSSGGSLGTGGVTVSNVVLDMPPQ